MILRPLFLIILPFFSLANPPNTFQVETLADLDFHINEIRQKRILGDTTHYILTLKNSLEIRESIFLDERDFNLTVTSSSKEEIGFSGGKEIDLRRITKAKSRSVFKQEAEDFIYYFDLDESEIPHKGKIFPHGFARPVQSVWMEFFLDGKPFRLTEWGDSTKRIQSVIEAGSKALEKNEPYLDGTFTYVGEIPEWSPENEIFIEGYFHHGYSRDFIPLKKIDREAKTITAAPVVYRYASGKKWQRWKIINVKEELNKEGEYYLDRKENRLYFFTKKTFSKAEISIMEKPLFVLKNVSDITLDNLEFSTTKGIGVLMYGTKNVTISNSKFKNIGGIAIFMGKGQIIHGRNKYLKLLGENHPERFTESIYDSSGGKNNSIFNCDISDCGMGAITLNGGNRKTLTSGNNEIRNCLIKSVNRINHSSHAPIRLYGVGNKILNNEISDAPSMAILLHGNNHLIKYNNIHHVCLDVDDIGALYYGRDASERGHIVKHNYFHHIGSGYRTRAIFHDDGACGMRVEENIFFKAGSENIYIGGGSDISYHNNIFIDAPSAVNYDDRMLTWAAFRILEGGIMHNRLLDVNYDKPPYSVRYPEIKNYLIHEKGISMRNTFTHNIFVDMESVFTNGKQNLNWDNISNIHLSGLKRQWQGREDENGFFPPLEIIPKPKGWKRIPIEKIGIQK